MNEEAIRKEERDNFTVVLEGLRSDFKVFGENLDLVRQKGDMTFEELGKVKIEIVEIKSDIVEIKSDIAETKKDVKETNIRLGKVETHLDSIETEVKSLRKDFDFMKEELKDKISINQLKQFEKRLSRVEEKLEFSSTI